MRSLRDNFGGFGNRLFQLAYIYAKARRKDTPDIYLQDPKYFADCKEEIRALYGGDIEPIDKVSLHIRRGDYIGNPFYFDLSETDYYEKSVAEFPNERFLVFCADRQECSDDKVDMEWVKAYLEDKFGSLDRFEFFQGKDETQDFNAQAGCKAHITANSSFSWMASFTGGGKTVTPKNWYSDGRPGIPPMPEWIQI